MWLYRLQNTGGSFAWCHFMKCAISDLQKFASINSIAIRMAAIPSLYIAMDPHFLGFTMSGCTMDFTTWHFSLSLESGMTAPLNFMRSGGESVEMPFCCLTSCVQLPSLLLFQCVFLLCPFRLRDVGLVQGDNLMVPCQASFVTSI